MCAQEAKNLILPEADAASQRGVEPLSMQTDWADLVPLALDSIATANPIRVWRQQPRDPSASQKAALVPFAPVDAGKTNAADPLLQGGRRLATLHDQLRLRRGAHLRMVQSSNPWPFLHARTETVFGSAEGYTFREAAIPRFDLLESVADQLRAAERSLSTASRGQAQELKWFAWRVDVAEAQLRNYDKLLIEYRQREHRGQEKLGAILTGVAATASGLFTFGTGALPAALASGGAAAITRSAIDLHHQEFDGEVIRWDDLVVDAARSGVEYGLPVFVGMRVFNYLSSSLPFYLGKHVPEALLIEIGEKLGFAGAVPRDVFAKAMQSTLSALANDLASLGSAASASAVSTSVIAAVEQLYREPGQAMTLGQFSQVVGEQVIASVGLQALILAAIRGGAFVLPPRIQGSRELPEMIPWYSDGEPALIDLGQDWARHKQTPQMRHDLAAATEWLTAFGRKYFPPDYQPIFFQYLIHRGMKPIASPEVLSGAIDARTAMGFVEWLRGHAVKAVPDGSEGIFLATNEGRRARDLVDAANRAIAQGHLSALELDSLVESYFQMLGASSVRIHRPVLNQQPPNLYLVRPFEVAENSPTLAVYVPTRSVGPPNHDWWADGSPKPKFEFPEHDDYHNESLVPHDSHRPGNRGRSAVHDLPLMLRNSDFSGAVQAVARGLDPAKASHLQQVYWVLMHEETVSPEPQYLLMHVQSDPGWVAKRTKDTLALEGKTVSEQDIENAIATFSLLCRWYLAALPDGSKRLIEAQFRFELRQQKYAVPEVTHQVRRHINSESPTPEDYQLFLSDPHFRDRVRRNDGSESELPFETRYEGMTKFVAQWAARTGPTPGHPIHVEPRKKLVTK